MCMSLHVTVNVNTNCSSVSFFKKNVDIIILKTSKRVFLYLKTQNLQNFYKTAIKEAIYNGDVQ